MKRSISKIQSSKSIKIENDDAFAAQASSSAPSLGVPPELTGMANSPDEDYAAIYGKVLAFESANEKRAVAQRARNEEFFLAEHLNHTGKMAEGVSKDRTFRTGFRVSSLKHTPSSSGSSRAPPPGKRRAPVGQWKTPENRYFMAASGKVMPKSASSGSLSSLHSLSMGMGRMSAGLNATTSGLSFLGEDLHKRLGEITNTLKKEGEKALEIANEKVTNALQPFVSMVRRVSSAGEEITPPTEDVVPEDSEALMKEMAHIGLGPPVMPKLPQSDSCPDLAIEDDPNDDEETRKMKRLARNRASAQMRRLRKRTIVRILQDESEVLEQRLKSIRAGRNRATLSLLYGEKNQGETLSTARKQVTKQFIIDRHIASLLRMRRATARNCALLATATQASKNADAMVAAPSRIQGRATFIKACRDAGMKDLAANLEQSKVLPKELLEEANAVLLDKVGGVGVHTNMARGIGRAGKGYGLNLEGEIARFDPKSPASVSPPADMGTLSEELSSLLQLTDEQRKKIALVAPNIHREQVKLESATRAFLEIVSHDWLEFPQTDLMRQEFNSVLKPEQLNHITLLNDYYLRLEQVQTQMNT